jgi:hypothetical protein
VTEKEAKLAVNLCKAVAELPATRKALSDTHPKGRSDYVDAVYLELSAAEMSGGEGQGAEHYFYVPPAIEGHPAASIR